MKETRAESRLHPPLTAVRGGKYDSVMEWEISGIIYEVLCTFVVSWQEGMNPKLYFTRDVASMAWHLIH